MFNGRRVRYLLCIARKTESDGPGADSFNVMTGSYQGTSDSVVKNTGTMDRKEVIQAYMEYPERNIKDLI